MKKKLTVVAIFIGSILVSCSDNPATEKETEKHDPCLEDVLEIQSEKDLITKYGQESVSYDTIWGAEGFYTMGTLLRTDEQSHVEIMWLDSAKRLGMVSATLVSDEDYYAEKIDAGKWKSCTGVALGMSLADVEAINGKPFQFSGFGWDYGGGIISWQGGKLDNRGFTIQIAEGPGDEQMSETEANSVLGDITVMSNDPTARKLKPRVWSISVAKTEAK